MNKYTIENGHENGLEIRAWKFIRQCAKWLNSNNSFKH